MILAALLLALAGQDPGPAVVVAQDAVQPALALDPDGNPVVAFVRNGGIEVASSPDKGKTFAAPVTAIEAKGRTPSSNQRGPRVAVDASRRVYVTGFANLDPARPSPDLWLAVSTDRGKSFAAPVRVSDRPDLPDQPSTVLATLHALAATPSGDLHVAWLDSRRGKGTMDLLLARITDHGKKVQRPQTAARDVCPGCAPALAVDSKGAPVLAYRDAAKPSRNVHWGPPSKAARANSVDSRLPNCPLDAPALALSPDGKNAALAWMDCRDAADECNVYWTSGPAAKPPLESTAHSVKTGAQTRPAVAVAKDGTAWCVWEDTRGAAAALFGTNSNDRVDFAVSRADESRAAFPSLAAAAGLVALAYESGESTVAFRILAGR